jgi:nitroreductase
MVRRMRSFEISLELIEKELEVKMDETQSKLLSVIMGRSSYRGKYKDKRIDREDLERIMQAGLSAPSGCNKMTTSLIAIDDPALLQELKDLIDPPICETAPAMIFVLTRRIFAYRNKCFSVQDYSAAIENILLAAKALGYESCWYEGHITDDDNKALKLANRLGVPADHDLVCLLPIGYADEEVSKAKKKAFEERAWFNGFHGMTQEGRNGA